MIDVSAKPETIRTASARALVRLPTADAVSTRKGDSFLVATLAGIQATKRTSELIPLCHPVGLEHADCRVRQDGDSVRVDVKVRTSHKTGVEMEALTGATIAALTVIDMLKGSYPVGSLRIESVELRSKTGGKRGDYVKNEQVNDVT